MMPMMEERARGFWLLLWVSGCALVVALRLVGSMVDFYS
jgi:hypothetical protein